MPHETETVIHNTFVDRETFEAAWNYLYPWGSDHNGTARMFPDQVRLEDGVLVLKASRLPEEEGASKENPHLGIRYHSGAVHAKHRVEVTSEYPVHEIQGDFQAPYATGTWPAFWLTTHNPWPPEIDILEFKGHATNCVNTFRPPGDDDLDTIHVPVFDPDQWHTYRAVLTKVNATDVIFDFYLGAAGEEPARRGFGYGADFVGKPMWLIVNLQMEGSSGEPGPFGDTFFCARNVRITRTRA